MFKTFLRDESGASAAEYALILAVVGAGIAAAAFYLGDAVETAIAHAETEVENCTGANATETSCPANGTTTPTGGD